jgi:Xaa-Pro aminopeptidase
MHDFDPDRMQAYRLGRLQAQLQHHDCAAAVLLNPINARYATGLDDAQIFNLHSPSRCAVIPAEGLATIFLLTNAPARKAELNTVDEMRPAPAYTYFPAGELAEQNAVRWAKLVGDNIREKSEGKRIAVDLIEPIGYTALQGEGFDIIGAERLVERATAIKSADEVACLKNAVAVADIAMGRIHEALEPGVSENDMFAILHQTNIEHGGEWIDYRLMAAGDHANPWGRQCGPRKIADGELLAFDCGMIGPQGYSADVSRTFLCGDRAPSDEQKRLYGLAHDNVHFNLDLVRAGVGFRELSDKGWPLPAEFLAHRYDILAHGIGMGDEWPIVPFPCDWDKKGADGELQAGMVICIESFIGSEHGGEGVKLEQQILVTDTGHDVMSAFPFEAHLLS